MTESDSEFSEFASAFAEYSDASARAPAYTFAAMTENGALKNDVYTEIVESTMDRAMETAMKLHAALLENRALCAKFGLYVRSIIDAREDENGLDLEKHPNLTKVNVKDIFKKEDVEDKHLKMIALMLEWATKSATDPVAENGLQTTSNVVYSRYVKLNFDEYHKPKSKHSIKVLFSNTGHRDMNNMRVTLESIEVTGDLLVRLAKDFEPVRLPVAMTHNLENYVQTWLRMGLEARKRKMAGLLDGFEKIPGVTVYKKPAIVPHRKKPRKVPENHKDYNAWKAADEAWNSNESKKQRAKLDQKELYLGSMVFQFEGAHWSRKLSHLYSKRHEYQHDASTGGAVLSSVLGYEMRGFYRNDHSGAEGNTNVVIPNVLFHPDIFPHRGNLEQDKLDVLAPAAAVIDNARKKRKFEKHSSLALSKKARQCIRETSLYQAATEIYPNHKIETGAFESGLIEARDAHWVKEYNHEDLEKVGRGTSHWDIELEGDGLQDYHPPRPEEEYESNQDSSPVSE